MALSNQVESSAAINLKKKQRRRRIGLFFGLVIVALFVGLSILASWLHKGAYEGDLMRTFAPPRWQAGGTAAHLLGKKYLDDFFSCFLISSNLRWRYSVKKIFNNFF